jgi:hypothetical protein
LHSYADHAEEKREREREREREWEKAEVVFTIGGKQARLPNADPTWVPHYLVSHYAYYTNLLWNFMFFLQAANFFSRVIQWCLVTPSPPITNEANGQFRFALCSLPLWGGELTYMISLHEGAWSWVM